MPLLAPSQRLLEASLQGLLSKLDPRDDRIVVYRANPAWSGPDRVTVRRGGSAVEFRVVGCGSALAVREALVEQAASDGHFAILTDRPVEDLGEDVLARVFKRTVISPDAWEAVKVAFQARQVDPSLASEKWMPEALLESPPTGGYQPVPAGMLDAETAWRSILERWGITEPTPSVETLLRWTLDSANMERWRSAATDRRDAATKWLLGRAGASAPVVSALLRLVEKGEGASALPLGLALGVVFDPAHKDDSTLKGAGIRMESVLGAAPVDPAMATTWADAATVVIAEMVTVSGRKRAQPQFDAAEQLLERVQASRHAYVSPWLPLGLTQRLDRYGERLRDALAATPVVRSSALEDATRSVVEHRLAQFAETGARAVEMATRLVRWLADRRARADGDAFSALLSDYSKDGGFVDWARTDLSFDGTSPLLSDAFRALRARVDDVRDQENRQFAASLARWLESGATVPLPIERVLDEVVVPLAAKSPVLVLVLDGMSVAVFRELIDDVTRRGWTELMAEESHRNGPVVAVIPTVTEVSRTSLFCGRLVRGNSATEKQGFSEHAGLRGVSTKAKPPFVYHKDEVSRGGAGLPPEVAAMIADGARRVVGLVVNAVDDWLLKGEQMRPTWTASGIVGLEAILAAAREGGRNVVLLSDHGHTIERGTEFRTVATEGERWRSIAEPLVDGEIRLGGPRVRAVVGADIVAPCTERLRYGAKRNGYHGGATPQEVTVPMAVLTLSGEIPAGWREAAPWMPEWWKAPERAAAAAAPAVVAVSLAPAPSQKPATGQLPLFTPPAPPTPVVPVAQAAASPDVSAVAVPAWVGQLLASATFKEQLQRNARLGLDADRARGMLTVLATRGGVATRDMLVAALSLPVVRVASLLAASRRVLNIDGLPVLGYDETSETLRLNMHLLEAAYGIGNHERNPK